MLFRNPDLFNWLYSEMYLKWKFITVLSIEFEYTFDQ